MSLAVDSNRAGRLYVFVMSASGGGEAEQLLTRDSERVVSWSSDGSAMILFIIRGRTGQDIDLLRLDGNGEPETLLGTRFNESQPSLSPDDRWLAYASDESGRSEVFVVSFPDAGRKWQISRGGGTEPMWARDGRELFYRNRNKMMSVAIDTAPELTPAKPVLVFEGSYAEGRSLANYDVAPNDEGFIMIRQEQGREARMDLEVILNWVEELKRLVPTEN